jgi:hypothetical protein
MSMNKFNDLNEWEDDYYSRKHRSRTATAGYAFYLAVFAIALLALFTLFSCNRTAYSPEVLQSYQPIQHERIACDTLIDRATGEHIPVYNCETTW